jgi:hypothetical protein
VLPEGSDQDDAGTPTDHTAAESDDSSFVPVPVLGEV